jgi:trimeric autotransporter adhesin
MNKRGLFLVLLVLAALWLSNPQRVYSSPPLAPATPLGSGFGYQGYLKDAGGNPINSTCDLRFGLWDALSGGSQIGANSTAGGVSVVNGYFSALVNAGSEFGAQPFDNLNARWLEVSVQCTGDPGFTTLTPRQPVGRSLPTHDHWGQTWSGSGTGLSLTGGSVGLSGKGSTYGLYGETSANTGRAIYGLASATTTQNIGVVGESRSSDGLGVYGYASATTGTNYAVYGRTDSPDGRGVFGWASTSTGSSVGVYGIDYSTVGRGVYGLTTASTGQNFGVVGESRSTDGMGVYGYASSTTGNNFAVYGRTDSPDGRGVFGWASTSTGSSVGVYGIDYSTVGRGVYGLTTASTGQNIGVAGESRSTDGLGVYGYASATTGANYAVYGRTDSPDGRGVFGWASTTTGKNAGVYGITYSPDGYGVYAVNTSTNGWGLAVYGATSSDSGFGVMGIATNTTGGGLTYPTGVYGQTDSQKGVGVAGFSNTSTGTGVGIYGDTNSPNGYAGYFNSRVYVNGSVEVTANLNVTGTITKGGGGFKIDHLLDPANQYLYHSFVESPDMLDIYNGTATLDGSGQAVVQLPAWFEALNQDFHYQLTCLGGYAPVYIAQGVQNNAFQIAGGSPGMQVSWQVTGVRHDPWAEAHRLPVEQPKLASDQGKYLYPDLYGLTADQGIGYVVAPDLSQPLATTAQTTTVIPPALVPLISLPTEEVPQPN